MTRLTGLSQPNTPRPVMTSSFVCSVISRPQNIHDRIRIIAQSGTTLPDRSDRRLWRMQVNSFFTATSPRLHPREGAYTRRVLSPQELRTAPTIPPLTLTNHTTSPAEV